MSWVQALPTALGANGQPPRPEMEESKRRTPAWKPANVLLVPAPVCYGNGDRGLIFLQRPFGTSLLARGPAVGSPYLSISKSDP